MSKDKLNARKIKENCDSTNLIKSIVIHDVTESTMNDARKVGEEVTLVLTEEQRATHGRFKRAYFSDDHGGGIYMTLSFMPYKKFEELPQYTILAAVAVEKAILKLTDTQVDIKWVNDIYLNGKKMCGILTEAMSNPETQEFERILIGIGLNFSIQQFPKEIREKATSLFFDEVPTITRNELVAEIWNQFFIWEKKDFLTEYKKHSFVLGKMVSFTKKGEDFAGIAEDITDMGELVVNVNGERYTLYSGEISLTSIGEKVYRKD